MFDNDARSLRLPNHVQQTEYNGQDHPSTSSTPVELLTIILTKVSFQALKFLDRLSKSKDYVSYSQNLGEVCTDYG